VPRYVVSDFGSSFGGTLAPFGNANRLIEEDTARVIIGKTEELYHIAKSAAKRLYSSSTLVAHGLLAVFLFLGHYIGFWLCDDIRPPGLRLVSNSNLDCFFE